MMRRIIEFIFYGNYFVGLLAVALSIELSTQLYLPYNSLLYYILIFCAPVMYYTYAYTAILHSDSPSNLRSEWYKAHKPLTRITQPLLLAICILCSLWMLGEYWQNILHLPAAYWLIIGGTGMASVLYYGLLPKSLIKINLRNTGWLKAFVIGFVWGAFVSLLPIIALHVEGKATYVNPVIVLALFIKNWMFCTVNAIMFDMKDYEDDSNRQLQTFAVTFGIHRTITFILIPLSVIGMLAMLGVTTYRHFGWLAIAINAIPFVLLLIASWSMHRQRNILYYLIVIDGIVLVKALCGIFAMHFVP
ncbi:MAG: UbiA family prenyltransferase [Bacteroidetes bacterium]|nr:UbiA family prenyltransferase [Bacteroidota bacterium]